MVQIVRQTSNLLIRNDFHYFRYRFPRDLAKIIGRSELKLSLNTTDEVIARYRTRKLRPVIDDIKLSYRYWKMNELNEQEISAIIEAKVNDAFATMQQELKAEISESLHSALGQTTQTANSEINPETSSDNNQLLSKLCQLLETQTSLMQQQISTASQTHQIQAKPDLDGVTTSIPISLEQAWNEYFDEKANGKPKPEWNAETAASQSATMEEFIMILGSRDLQEYDRTLIRHYRDTLASIPKNYNKRFPNKNLEQLLKIAKTLPSSAFLSSRTIQEKLMRIGTFFKWCIEQKEYLDKSPTKGITVKATSTSYAPFNPTDLKKIFLSNAYIDDEHNTTWKYWIPLIGLYTGARLSEIAQLATNDIANEDGVWIFRINDENGKTVKTKAGIRSIPIHSELLKLGIIDYLEMLKAIKANRFFPDLKKGSVRWGHNVSKWFNDTYKKQCKIDDSANGGRKVFHSFRHTAITAALSNGQKIAHCQQVFGHEKSILGETATYTHHFPIESLVPVIESLAFSLDHSSCIDNWRHMRIKVIRE